MKMNVFVLLICLLSTQLFSVNPIAEALKVKGDVVLSRNEQDYDVIQGDDFFNGDQVETKTDAFAAIKFADESSLVKLFPNTILKIYTEKKNDSLIKKNLLEMGELWAKVEKGSGTFEVETPTTVASVKGTNFLMNVTDTGVTQLFTFDGSVELTNNSDGETVFVNAGDMCETTGFGVLSTKEIDFDMIDESVSNFINENVISKEPKKSKKPRRKQGESSSSASEIQEPEIEDEQEGSSSSGSSGPFNMGGGLGTVILGENTYTSIRLMPELTLGKVGIGLDVELLIDENGKIRKKDWDDWQDYVNKIYYLRYGLRGDKFFGRIGGFPDYTLAHGLLIKDYSNMLLYPDVKQLGLQLGGRIPYMGTQVEVFTSNINENQIIAGRATIQPLTQMSLPIIRNISFGLTAVTDRDQYGGLTDEVIESIPIDTDGDGIYDEYDIDPDGDGLLSLENLVGLSEEDIEALINAGLIDSFEDLSKLELYEDPISGISIDYNLPLLQNRFLSLGHYAELATILQHKSGLIFPGFYSKFLIFNTNLEYRIFQDDFAPGYFGNLYDQQRAMVSGDSIIIKETTLATRVKSRGWFGSITANIFNTLFITTAYEDMYPDDGERYQSIWASASLDQKILPRLNRAVVKYSQADFHDFGRFKTPSSYISGEIGYALSGNTELVVKYQQRYIDYDGSGKIDSKEETITTMNMGIEFRF